MTRRSFLAQCAAAGGALAFGPAWAQPGNKQIAYVTPSLTESFWRNVVTGIESAAKVSGYALSTLAAFTGTNGAAPDAHRPVSSALIASANFR